MDRHSTLSHEFQVETLKAAPALVGAGFAGYTLNEWVAIVTIIYILLQAAYLLWKWRREAKSKRLPDGK